MDYMMGLSIGLACGLSIGLNSGTFSSGNDDNHDAKVETQEQSCKSLMALQEKLNVYYSKRASGEAEVPNFTLSLEDCMKASKPSAPAP